LGTSLFVVVENNLNLHILKHPPLMNATPSEKATTTKHWNFNPNP
jgi:hypothetical protein